MAGDVPRRNAAQGNFIEDEFFHAAYSCKPWLKYFESRYVFLIAS
jgi:hypothetical protein